MEKIVTSAIFELQRVAEKRIEDLLETVQGLVSARNESAPQIRADLERLQAMAAQARSDDVRIERKLL